jgi:hypothetical protein
LRAHAGKSSHVRVQDARREPTRQERIGKRHRAVIALRTIAKVPNERKKR